MKPMNTLIGNELLWKQPKFSLDAFELYQDDDLFAEVYWTKLLSDAAVAKVAGSWWTFDRLGWLRDKVVATVANSEQAVASFEFDWLKNGTSAWPMAGASSGIAPKAWRMPGHWLKAERKPSSRSNMAITGSNNEPGLPCTSR